MITTLPHRSIVHSSTSHTLASLLCPSPAAGDEKAVEKLVKSKSERSRVKESIAAALRAGDLQTAQELQDRLQLLTDARYDPTQEEGAYQRDMDQDEWYLRSRRT